MVARRRALVLILSGAFSVAGCSSDHPGSLPSPRKSIPSTVRTLPATGSSGPTTSAPVSADARLANNVVRTLAAVRVMARHSPYVIARISRGSAGTRPDRRLVVIVLRFERPVSVPAGWPHLRSRSEGDPPLSPDRATVAYSAPSAPTQSVTIFIDPVRKNLFAIEPYAA